ncbi:MAG: hypothetical protein KKA05_07215 [Alphaproteobacteria bacterium]|nr:hypothetical protein [Alphaproteobacteria bacterium]
MALRSFFSSLYRAAHIHPRRRVVAALVLVLLTAGPAWSIERGTALPGQPQIEKFTVAPAPAPDPCAVHLNNSKKAKPVQTTSYGEHHVVIPAALYGLVVGARYATGPRQNHEIVKAAAIEDNSNKAQAIATWRRCRADIALRGLSN